MIRIFDSKSKQKELDIKVTSPLSLYITLNGWVYYIDDSTNEQIISKREEEKWIKNLKHIII